MTISRFLKNVWKFVNGRRTSNSYRNNNCLNKLIELKFCEVSRNSFSNRFWKFQFSILKNKKNIVNIKTKKLCLLTQFSVKVLGQSPIHWEHLMLIGHVTNSLKKRTSFWMRKHLITPQDDQKATGQRAHLDAILSEFPASRGRQHCIEGMLIMMMMNCPVADVALMILPRGRETSHCTEPSRFLAYSANWRLLTLTCRVLTEI